MKLISDGIEKIRAFELPAGIWANGEYVGTPRATLVKWTDKINQGKIFYHVYVNGQYAGSTVDSQQRQMIVPTPTSFQSAVRIEVFAVEAEHAHIDLSKELVSLPATSGRVRISLLRSQNPPSDATAEIYFDNGTGIIDYNQPLSDRPLRIWPAWQDKTGFGMCRFGTGDFGFPLIADRSIPQRRKRLFRLRVLRDLLLTQRCRQSIAQHHPLWSPFRVRSSDAHEPRVARPTTAAPRCPR